MMDGYYQLHTAALIAVVLILYINVLSTEAKYSIYEENGGQILSDGFGQYYPPYHEGGADGYEQGYMSDWNRNWPSIHGNQPKCIDIPSNMSLCQGIGYNQMRLPNLLEHDTLKEVTSQAATWTSLLRLSCHPDTQLFLCSLFSPVCLDRPIYPCRNLCEAVKAGCESRMLRYGFPWPEILTCDKFPLKNDLCIGLMDENAVDPDLPPVEEHPPTEESSRCLACNQPNTFEAIVDNYCRAKSVLRVKIRREVTEGSDKKLRTTKKKKVYKRGGISKKELTKLDVYIDNSQKCDCGLPQPGEENSYFFAMGEKRGEKFYAQAVHKYDKNNREMRKALRAIRKKDNICDKKGMAVLEVKKGLDMDEVEESELVKSKKGKKKKGKSGRKSGVTENSEVTTGLDAISPTGTTLPTEQEVGKSKKKAARKNRNRKRNNAKDRRQRGNNKKSRSRTQQET